MTDRNISSDDMLVLEGMYKGVARQIDEVKGVVGKEIQTSSTQQLSALESLIQNLKENTATLLDELKYISQQSSAIYEYQEVSRKSMHNELLEAVRTAKPAESPEARDKRLEELFKNITKQHEAENRVVFDKLVQATRTAVEKSAEESRVAFNRILKEKPALKESLAAIISEENEKTNALKANEYAKEVAEQTARLVSEQTKEALEEQTNRVVTEQTARIMAEETERIVSEQATRLLSEQTEQVLGTQIERIISEQSEKVLAAQIEKALAERAEKVLAEQTAQLEKMLTDKAEAVLAEKIEKVLSAQTQKLTDEADVLRENTERILAAKAVYAEGGAGGNILPQVEKLIADQTSQIISYTDRIVTDRVDQVVSVQVERVLKVQAAQIAAQAAAEESRRRAEEDRKRDETMSVVEETAIASSYEPTETKEQFPLSEIFDYDILAEKIATILPEVDYDMIADKVSSIIPEMDYDMLVDKISLAVPHVSDDSIAERVAEVVIPTDYDLVAERVANTIADEFDITVSEEGVRRIADSVIAELNYEQLAAKVAELLGENGVREGAAAGSAEVDYDEIARRVAEVLQSSETENFDAEQVAAIIQEQLPEYDYDEAARRTLDLIKSDDSLFDYDEAAQRVAEVVRDGETEVDYDVIAEKVARLVRENEEAFDYDEVSRRVLEALKSDETIVEMLKADDAQQVDYDEIARRVSEIVKVEDKQVDYDEIARRVSELVKVEDKQVDYDEIARRVSELVKGDESDLDRIAAMIAAQPVQRETVKVVEKAPEPAREIHIEQEPDPEPEIIKVKVPAKKPDPEIIKVKVPAKKPATKVVIEEEEDDDDDDDAVGFAETAGDPALMTRYKRSFLAKIIQSDDDVKYFYSELKNEILAYSKVNSQLSWSNDRFTKSRETIAKIGIRGKTLCLYLSLNPDEFATSVYHQTFVGDTKMYEKTPMMVKIKSQTALKRAMKLIALLMEKEEAVRRKSFAAVDYVKMYRYKKDSVLLNEGLIKTTLVEKVDLKNFD